MISSPTCLPQPGQALQQHVQPPGVVTVEVMRPKESEPFEAVIQVIEPDEQ